jgi:hypothetical protein
MTKNEIIYVHTGRGSIKRDFLRDDFVLEACGAFEDGDAE